MNKRQVLFSFILSIALVVSTSVNAQIKNLKGAKNKITSEADKDIENAKYLIDQVMENPETKDLCSSWGWKAIIYTEIAVSDDPLIMALDPKGEAALTAGEAMVKFYSYPAEEREKLQTEESAAMYLPNSMIACFNKGVNASANKNSYALVKRYMDIVEILSQYDKEDKAKSSGVSKEKALNLIWRAAYNDSLTDMEIVYLEKLIAIPTYMNSNVYVRLSEIYASRKEYDKALGYLEKGKEKIPQKSGEFLDQQINIEIARNNMASLISKFDEAILNNPDNTLYFYSRGACYHNLRISEIKEQEQAIKAGNKPNPSKYSFLAALKDYAKAIELDASNYTAVMQEAYAMRDSANYIYKLRVRVASNEYEKYNALSQTLYKEALIKFETLRSAGFLKEQDLIDMLYDIKTICIKLNNNAEKEKYDALIKAEEKKLRDKGE